MYQKNLGRQLWAILSPVLVQEVVLSIVQLIFMGIWYVENLDKVEVLSGTPEEVWYEVLEMMLVEVTEYSVEIMGIAAVCCVPILLYMMRRDYRRETAAGILQNVKAPLIKYGWIVGISVPFAVGMNNIIHLSNLAAYSEAYQEATEVFYGADLAIQVVCLGVLTPMVEELIFRGLIYKRMRTAMNNPKSAIIFSGLLFGFYHGNIVQTIYACLSGFLLAYIYEKYGSIKAPILAHIMMNMAALILSEANMFVWMFSDILRMGIITVACGTIASTAFLFIQKIEEKPLKNEAN